MRVTVVGAGIFGATAALTLAERGHTVVLCDAGPIPHPLASSTDRSKLVRMDYGHDAWWLTWMQQAMPGWHAWNARAGAALYHEDGVLMFGGDWCEGGFEHDSHRHLLAHGEDPLRLPDPDAVTAHHPAWRAPAGGYVSRRAGWAASARVVAQVVDWARDAGVDVRPGQPLSLDGLPPADRTLIATGAWTPVLLPELADRLRAVGQPILCLRVRDPARWRAPRFLPWACDIAHTGFYGFPAGPDGLIKIAHHGAGLEVDAQAPRKVPPTWDARFRAFLAAHLPELADAPIVSRRLCVYCDSFDGAFLVDEHPDRPDLVVATGGSGHGFKFAPVLGDLIADVVEGRPHPRRDRFRWRERGPRVTEHARSDA